MMTTGTFPLFKIVQRLPQCVAQLEAEGVAPFGIVQSEHADLVFQLARYKRHKISWNRSFQAVGCSYRVIGRKVIGFVGL